LVADLGIAALVDEFLHRLQVGVSRMSDE
jgi:hypothetical protein